MNDIRHPPDRITLYSCQFKDRGGVLHPCSRAHRALKDAGVDHDLTVFGAGRPGGIGMKGKRPELKRISGQEKLPVLALADGTTVTGSGAIVAWAKERAAGT